MRTKEQKIELFESLAPDRDFWKGQNQYYYRDIEGFIASLVPAGSSVLEIGCGTGDLLARTRPGIGVGVDFSRNMIQKAKEKYPKENYPTLDFLVDDVEDLVLDGIFDYVVMSDCIGELTDISLAFRNLQKVTSPESRLVITYFNALWEPILRLGERLGLKMPQNHQNWLSINDIENLMGLNGFEVINKGYRLLFPRNIPIISTILNKVIANIPFFRSLCLVIYLVARPCKETLKSPQKYSVSVVVPCRNEKGNIRAAVERIPEMGSGTEILFVDGNSNDGTVEEITRNIDEYRGRKDIKLIHQLPKGLNDGAGHGRMLKLGKGDAVRKGFAAAAGEILMILDADLTVPPEDLPKFYLALSEGRGELIIGSRLVYPMEKEAMRFLNKFGNKFFSLLFTWILGQRIKDTLCGTKTIFKKDYGKIEAGRDFFGNFDPFGDFDLIFGASRQNLKIAEIPIRYRERTYGEIKIERFRHGVLLLKMSFFALIKLKLR